MDWKDTELGHQWSKADLKRHFRALYGGVAWPGQRPGFVVVVGLANEKHFDSYDVYLLDECESVDTRELVRQMGVLDYRYEPARWVGDPYNDAADRFLRELNEERQAATDSATGFPAGRRMPRYLCPIPSPVLDMKRPYSYILAELKWLLDADRRQLFLKTSRVKDYLTTIEPDEVPALEFGAYPAIEALALAGMAIRQDATLDIDDGHDMDLANSYAVRELL